MPNNFEGGFDRPNTSIETNPLIIAASKKARGILESDPVVLEDFEGLYTSADIENDKNYVEERKNDFEIGSDKMLADTFEAVIYQQSELSEWFGPHATTLKTSEYDDIANGIDLTVEFNEPQKSASHLALGIDVTFGTTSLKKKFSRIKQEIDSGKLAHIKYFRGSNDRNIKGLPMVPRVVIGMERQNVLQLLALWTEGKKKELGAHPAQRLILQEIREQLKTFSTYAKEVGQEHLVVHYNRNIGIIDSILKEKTDVALGALENDRVYKDIQHHLRAFSMVNKRILPDLSGNPDDAR